VNAEERKNLLHEVNLAGNCSNPIRIKGEMVNLTTGEVGLRSLHVTCKDRRAIICPSCSYLYKADAWILVSSGLVGGKGTPEEVQSHPRLFITLTAPSFGTVHTIKSRGECAGFTRSALQSGGGGFCVHGRPRICRSRHEEGSPELGRPLCRECFDYEGAVLWNAHASKLWNNTVQVIRRTLAETGGMRQSQLKLMAQLHYLKVAEMQRRGLIHLHAILRVDGPNEIEADPPAWLTTEVLASAVRHAARTAIAIGFDGQGRRWGDRLDIQDLGIDIQDTTKIPSYVAKYATKTTDGTKEMARKFHSRRQIQSLIDDPHARMLALTSWDLDHRPAFEPLRLRSHAHSFGFTGQLITKSRGYSTTFAALRGVRATYMSSRNIGDPIEGTFRYEGRGYDDPKASELAELLFSMQRDLRIEIAQARREALSKGPEASP
jgi:hypothetical protein